MTIRFSGEELLEMGVKIEELGETYYREFANKAKNKDVKDLLEFLADEEVKHRNLFIQFQKNWGKNDFIIPLLQEEVSAYLRSVVSSKVFSDKRSFMEKFKDLEDPLDIISNAIIFEKDTILFYHEMKSFVNEEKHKIINDLIAEEKRHVIKLEEIKQTLI